MIYIAICEDNETEADSLKQTVTSYLADNHALAELTIYTQSKNLKYDIQEGKHFDLLLSDIEMPDIDGMKLAAYIKQYLPDILIIFITNHLKYAVDAFELSVFRYITKNAADNKLIQALNDAVHMITLQADRFYTIQTPNRIEKIAYQRILYIQREGKNSVLTLTDNSTAKVRKSLAQIFEEFSSEDFIYIERGIIVNLAHVTGMTNGIIELKNGIHLPASHAKLEELKNRLIDLWRTQI